MEDEAGKDGFYKAMLVNLETLDIVPGDFITPFVKGNTLQIVFMAVVSGVVILSLDSEVSGLREAAVKLNRFCQFILVSICELMSWVMPQKISCWTER